MRHKVPTIDGIPVLLPPHEHIDFGTPGMHYHVDFRYTKEPYRQDRVIHTLDQPVLLSLEKVRDTYEVISENITLILWLSRRFADRTSCNKCPHKGLPIINGLCTGHGMAFNKGAVCTNYFLRLGKTLEKADYWRNKYDLLMEEDGVASFLELVTDGGQLVSRLKFTTLDKITYSKGDLVRVNTGPLPPDYDGGL